MGQSNCKKPRFFCGLRGTYPRTRERERGDQRTLQISPSRYSMQRTLTSVPFGHKAPGGEHPGVEQAILQTVYKREYYDSKRAVPAIIQALKNPSPWVRLRA